MPVDSSCHTSGLDRPGRIVLEGWCPPGVGAVASLRHPGWSQGPWSGLNLGTHVGDDPKAVARNRTAFAGWLGGARPVWLDQVHGARVIDATSVDLSGPPPQADASWTNQVGRACVVMVADCLPVLFAHRRGGFVAAAHAGWRGLAAGVLEATLHTVCRHSGSAPSDWRVWIGPAIGPHHFEVGADVLEALGESGSGFRPKSVGPDGQPRWWADLPGLARSRLQALGVTDIHLSGRCTAGEPDDFFSHRRDGRTGRQAVAIWLR